MERSRGRREVDFVKKRHAKKFSRLGKLNTLAPRRGIRSLIFIVFTLNSVNALANETFYSPH